MTGKKLNIKQIRKDGRNANQGTEHGDELLTTSFGKYGAGRSILVDRDNNIIAGNHAYDKAVEAGITDIIIVPTDGKTLVVVQRTDVELNSKKGREMAIMDNTSAKENINMDLDMIERLHEDFNLDIDALGVDMELPDLDDDDYDDEGSSEKSKSDAPTIKFEVSKTVLRQWEKFKEQHEFETDGGCFMAIFNHAKKTYNK